MKTLFSIAFVALAAVAVSASGAHADNAAGTCNSIGARALNAAQACWNFECFPEDPECADVGAALLGFFGNPACAEGFANGEIQGITNSAALMPDGSNDPGAVKHVGDVICSSVVDCGFCDAAIAFGVCLGGFCL